MFSKKFKKEKRFKIEVDVDDKNNNIEIWKVDEKRGIPIELLFSFVGEARVVIKEDEEGVLVEVYAIIPYLIDSEHSISACTVDLETLYKFFRNEMEKEEFLEIYKEIYDSLEKECEDK